MDINKINDNTKISEFYNFRDIYFSDKALQIGVDNRIRQQEILENLTNICVNLLDPICKSIGYKVKITSGYRCEILNEKVGGSIKSQHLVGEAVDLVCNDNKQLFNIILDRFLFDQLIWEKGNEKQPAWVHVSLKKDKNKNRKQSFALFEKK